MAEVASSEIRSHMTLEPPDVSPTLQAQRSFDVGALVRVLGIPRGFNEMSLPEGATAVTADEHPDVVVVTDGDAIKLIASQLRYACAAILPIINASPADTLVAAGEHLFDQACGANRAAIGETLTMVAPMVARVRALPPSVRASEDVRVLLLARIAVRGRGLIPRRDAGVRDTVVYGDSRAIPGLLSHAEELAELGLLHREFFDMLITCPRCASGRVCVRERCAVCRSSNLLEVPILHHLRCAYQAPEHEFANGDGFVCPKCRARLVNFGVDYDRPGSLSSCRTCGHASGESSVGFLCLDCQRECSSDDMTTRAIHRYEITAAGLACVRDGAVLPKSVERKDSAANRVRNFVARQSAAQKPYCILAAHMVEPPGHSAGRSTLQTRSLFASAMRETFTPETEIVDRAPVFLALLAGDGGAEVERSLPHIRESLERHLLSAPVIDYRVHSPQDIQSMIDAMLAA